MLVLHKRNEILDKDKDYINNSLKPSETNFYEPSRNDFIEVQSVSEVLQELNIAEQNMKMH